MSGAEQKRIQVRANAKRNGLTTIVIGLALILLSVLWLSLMPKHLTLPGFFLTSAGIVALLIGWFKVREPEHSIEITPLNIVYRHRLGTWTLEWENVQRYDQPRVTRGIEQKNLELVGFKIVDYETFIHSISPRLATHILMEQRPLLLQNPDKNCATGTCAGAELLVAKEFKLKSGKVLKGVQAMFAHRMKQLRESLGYDLFIAAAELDREPAEFVSLLKTCQSSLND